VFRRSLGADGLERLRLAEQPGEAAAGDRGEEERDAEPLQRRREERDGGGGLRGRRRLAPAPAQRRQRVAPRRQREGDDAEQNTPAFDFRRVERLEVHLRVDDSSESSNKPSGFSSRKRRISRSKASRLCGASSRDADGGAPARRRRRTTRNAAKKSPRVDFDATSPTTRATTRRLAAVRTSERFPVIFDPARDTTPIGCVMTTHPTDGSLF
jgi:hypothetical protein